jgi:hypothetical protein
MIDLLELSAGVGVEVPSAGEQMQLTQQIGGLMGEKLSVDEG